MPALGTEAWIAALDAALRGRCGEHVVVQHVLTDAATAWFVVVGPEGSSATTGRHEAADVVVSADVATTLAINAGALAAQEAFMDGRLRISGSLPSLSMAASALASMPGVAADASDDPQVT